MSPRPYTEAEDREIARMAREGVPVARMAQGLGRTPAAVTTRMSTLRRQGVRISALPLGPRPYPRTSPEERDEVLGRG